MNEEQDPVPEQSSESEPKKDRPRLRLRSLVVHEFRDVKPGTSLEFSDGFHIVLGKNATGKSTLLELIAAVLCLDFSGPFFRETPFHLQASVTLGRLSLEIEIRRKFERVRIATIDNQFIDLLPKDDTNLVVRVEHPQAPLLQWFQVNTGEDVRIYNEDPRHSAMEGVRLKFHGGVDALATGMSFAVSTGATVLNDGGYRVHPEVWSEYRWITDHPGTGAPFDEATGTLGDMVGHALSVIRGKGFRSSSPWLPQALDFDGGGEPVTLELLKDPLLAAVVKKLSFDDAKAYFGPAAKNNIGWHYSAPSFQFFRGGQAVRRHDQLSFGQKRLFSFAWYLACNLDIVVADELVNGLHAEWIDWCMETLRDRQSFLTSQNPILIDALPFASREELQRGIILCESHPAEDNTNQLSWRQLDDREADLITRALEQSRLDLLSDLLHALDLW